MVMDGHISGVATPGQTRACAHIKFTGVWGKKTKVKVQLLPCVITDHFHVDVKRAYR